MPSTSERTGERGMVVLRGATIVDGTGAPGGRGDVLVRDGRIAAIGGIAPVGGLDAHEIDLSGLVLAPGFIDIHTHYDAQVLWDPDLTPSSWHGVTTVVIGNCGFSLAPTRAAHRRLVVATLENVEDMAPDALEAGIRWEFESFPEYLDLLERIPKRLNVAAMIGHSALRLFTVGPDAVDRPSTPGEIAEMRTVLGQALDAGAIGFATSRSASHVGHGAKPVASRLADVEELLALVDTVTSAGRGVVQIAAGDGLDEVARLAARTDRPITWSALLTGRYAPTSATEMVDATAALPGPVWPQISCRPLALQLNLLEPRSMANVPAFADVLALPVGSRRDRYADTAWRAEARSQLGARWDGRWHAVTLDESERHAALCGRSLAELAEERSVHPLDAMVDLALEDDLRTRFGVVLLNDDEEELRALLRDQRTLLGLSDAGAHASQLCDACYATHLLGHWVRDRRALGLESAVWRLTGQPAAVFGFADRGVIRPGAVADLVAFDAATVGPADRARVHDLPGGADRIVVRARGVHHVWVGGRAVVEDGTPVEGAWPGRVVRSGHGHGG